MTPPEPPEQPPEPEQPRNLADFAEAIVGDPVFTEHLPGNFVRLEDLPARRRSRATKALESLIEHPNQWAVIRVFEADPSHRNPGQHYQSARQLAMKVEGGRSKDKASIEYAELAAAFDGHFETAVATDRKRSAVSARFVKEA